MSSSINEQTFSTIVDALVEKGYIVVEDAFSTQHLTDLLSLAKSSNNFTQAGISSSNSLHIDTTKRSDKTLWIDEDNGAGSEYLSFMSRLQEHLNRTLYLGLSYYEAHFALYEEGDFYEKHLDAFKGSKNRVVTTVLYLNEEWREGDGGELLIYNDKGGVLQKITPNIGTLVVFLSDTFPHEVLQSKTKRYSIAGWFRVDKR